MSWLMAAYGAVVFAVGLYILHLGRLKRSLKAEVDAAERPR